MSEIALMCKEVMRRILVNPAEFLDEHRSLLQLMKRTAMKLAATPSSVHGAVHAYKEEAAVWDIMGARGKKMKLQSFPGIMVS